MSGEVWSEVTALEHRVQWLRAEIQGLKAEGKWWEDKYMSELAARYRAIQYAAERGVYIPTDL